MTTEAMAAPRPLAPIGRRVLAVVIDGAIGGAAVTAVYLGFFFALAAAAAAGDAGAVLAVGAGMTAAVLAVTVAWLLVLSALQARGGSVGQRLTRVRVVRTSTGLPLSFGAALGRNVVFGLAGSIVIGYFSPLFDGSGRRQGWHDKVVSAVVIEAAPRPAADAPAGGPAPALPASSPADVVSAQGAASAPSWLPTALPVTPVTAAPSAAQWAAPAPLAPPTEAPGSPVPIAPALAVPPGIVSAVPGVTPGAPTAPPAAPPVPEATPATPPVPAATPAAPSAAAPAPPVLRAAPAAPAAESDPAIDETRMLPPRRERSAAVLTWDDGTEHVVTDRAVFGRNPEPVPGAAVFAVDDGTRSLSKTHFELALRAGSITIVDRESTNGTALGEGTGVVALTPGVPASVPVGAVVTIGERWFRVGERA